LATFFGVFALGAGAMMLPQADIAEARDAVATVARPRVIDGDTIEDLASGERIRLANIDTPEIRDGAHCAAERQHGERARTEVRLLLARAEQIAVRRTGREDDYGRTIAYVLVDGRDLGRTLVAEGLARPWRGRREPWCGSDGSLLR
jgi:endonuclease YncB( thermonuclease family)